MACRRGRQGESSQGLRTQPWNSATVVGDNAAGVAAWACPAVSFVPGHIGAQRDGICSGPACRAVSFGTRTASVGDKAGQDLPLQPCVGTHEVRAVNETARQAGPLQDSGDADRAVRCPGSASPAPTKVLATRMSNPAGVLYGQRLVSNLAHRPQPANVPIRRVGRSLVATPNVNPVSPYDCPMSIDRVRSSGRDRNR
jgi:hypothetical protein